MQEIEIAFRILKRGWWIILTTAILSVLVASYLMARTTPTYQTNLRMFVSVDMDELKGRDLVYSYSSLDGASIVTTFVELANSRRIRENAAAKNYQPIESFNEYTVSTEELPNSSVLEMVVTGPNPQKVQYFANDVAQSAVDFVRANYSAFKLEILDSAFLPTKPIKPNQIEFISVALILGIAFGILIAIGVDLLPNPIKAIQNWSSLDGPTHTLKRKYFERHINDWDCMDGLPTNLALIRLPTLPQLEEVLSPTAFKRVLNDITRIIRVEIRGKDVLSRWSNDCFAVLMPAVYSDQAAATLEQISHKLSNLYIQTETMGLDQLKPIIGAALATDNLSYASIIKSAESALVNASKNSPEGNIYLTHLPAQRELSKV